MDEMRELMNEYDRLSDALEPYRLRLLAKEDRSEPLSPAERTFEALWYYWSAALVNNGDVFSYVPFIIEHREEFEAIGAHGTLRACEELMPFYQEQQRLATDQEKGQYWWKTREERRQAEDHAEDMNPFARLLLAFAEKHLPEDEPRSDR
jgi:hypothetical protein